MQIQRHNDTITVTLSEECTIVNVEEHTQMVKEIFSQQPPVLRFELDTVETQEMDTAYLQLLLAIRSWVMKNGGKTVLLGSPSQCLTEALICYGIRNE